MQALGAQEPQAFVQPERGGVANFRLENHLLARDQFRLASRKPRKPRGPWLWKMGAYLICVLLLHGVYGPPYESRSNASLPVCFRNRQHGYVASICAAPMGLKLAHDDAYELAGVLVECLPTRLSALRLATPTVAYHEAEVLPLIQEVAVNVDTVRLGEILGDQLSYRSEVEGLLLDVVRHIPKRRGIRGLALRLDTIQHTLFPLEGIFGPRSVSGLRTIFAHNRMM